MTHLPGCAASYGLKPLSPTVCGEEAGPLQAREVTDRVECVEPDAMNSCLFWPNSLCHPKSHWVRFVAGASVVRPNFPYFCRGILGWSDRADGTITRKLCLF